jgi:predicted nucleic acid-binding protein
VKLVLDTDVVVAAMRSPRGASAEILRGARHERVVLTQFDTEKTGRFW